MLGSVEQKETQIKQMERALKTLKTNIQNKESTLNSQNKGRKQELHANRLRDVRKLVDTNRLILNEVQESVKCTVRYVVHWYFVSKIVLTYCGKNCSSKREKLLKFEAKGREFARFVRSLKQFIGTVKSQYNF